MNPKSLVPKYEYYCCPGIVDGVEYPSAGLPHDIKLLCYKVEGDIYTQMWIMKPQSSYWCSQDEVTSHPNPAWKLIDGIALVNIADMSAAKAKGPHWHPDQIETPLTPSTPLTLTDYLLS